MEETGSVLTAKRLFRIEVVFFQADGKLFVRESITRPFFCKGHGQCDMDEVVAWIKRCRDDNALPGMGSGKWGGYILVDCDLGHPCLILPKSIALADDH